MLPHESINFIYQIQPIIQPVEKFNFMLLLNLVVPVLVVVIAFFLNKWIENRRFLRGKGEELYECLDDFMILRRQYLSLHKAVGKLNSDITLATAHQSREIQDFITSVDIPTLQGTVEGISESAVNLLAKKIKYASFLCAVYFPPLSIYIDNIVNEIDVDNNIDLLQAKLSRIFISL